MDVSYGSQIPTAHDPVIRETGAPGASGAMYANGAGVPKSDTEVLKWYQLAADQGFEPAKQAIFAAIARAQVTRSVLTTRCAGVKD